MHRILAGLVLLGMAAQANEIVDVPVGMEWTRQFDSSSYEWNAANKYAGQVPTEPTGISFSVVALRAGTAPLWGTPNSNMQFEPDVAVAAWLERADGTARYNFTAPPLEPYSGTTWLAMMPAVRGDTLLSETETILVPADVVSEFAGPGIDFNLFVQPLNTASQIDTVVLSTFGGFPYTNASPTMTLSTGATPRDAWHVIADDPPSDPPATVPEPSTAAMLAFPLLLWYKRTRTTQ